MVTLKLKHIFICHTKVDENEEAMSNSLNLSFCSFLQCPFNVWAASAGEGTLCLFKFFFSFSLFFFFFFLFFLFRPLSFLITDPNNRNTEKFPLDVARRLHDLASDHFTCGSWGCWVSKSHEHIFAVGTQSGAIKFILVCLSEGDLILLIFFDIF